MVTSFAFRLALPIVVALLVAPRVAHAWGSEGHRIVGIVAEHFLRPDVRAQVLAMLAADTGNDLTTHDIAGETVWADKLREQNRNAAVQTREWHFVDIEVGAPDLDQACFGRPHLPTGAYASAGPAHDCIVDKIEEFEAELAVRTTSPAERVTALKFLLHFVGDLHQPLHAADEHDRGGNAKRLTGYGGRDANLHSFWDTTAVRSLGSNPSTVAVDIVASITPGDANAWQKGGPATWAMESFRIARDDAYGRLPPPDGDGAYDLTDEYRKMARRDVAVQLARAGVRLAAVLNGALAASERSGAVTAAPDAAQLNGKVISNDVRSIARANGRQLAAKVATSRAPDSGQPSCPGDRVVWVNTRSQVYHLNGDRYFGRTRSGSFVCEKDAIAAGDRLSQEGR